MSKFDKMIQLREKAGGERERETHTHTENEPDRTRSNGTHKSYKGLQTGAMQYIEKMVEHIYFSFPVSVEVLV